MIVSETTLLVSIGLALGVGCALVAVQPALAKQGGGMPVALVVGVFVAVLVAGLVSSLVAAGVASAPAAAGVAEERNEGHGFAESPYECEARPAGAVCQHEDADRRHALVLVFAGARQASRRSLAAMARAES